MKKPRITVRSTARDPGRRHGQAETYEVRCGGKAVATIQRGAGEQWFWYGFGNNTCRAPGYFDDVKAAAIAAVRAHFANV